MISDIMPVFLFVALGYFFKVFKRDISEGLIDFVICFSLPALALVKIRTLDFDEVVFNIIFIAYLAMFVSAIVSFAVGKMLKLERNILATFMVVSIFGNTSFVGFSYVESFYSSKELVYPLVYDQIGTFVAILTLGMVLIAWGAQREERSTLKQKIKMFFTPPLQAIIFAVIFHGVVFPEYVEGILVKLEYTLIPLVTIIVGMKLEIKAFKNFFKESIMALGVKMFLVPLIMLGILYPFFDFNATWMKITFIEIAMPPMTMATVLAIRGGLNKDLAINTLGLGILASFIIVPFWNYIVNNSI
ncbi:AEC family transporter [Sulfurospirillum arcachonense]|uniref:AEC family transporter n=1 Tax=Sulfurospirillum arcachonense TaxID=57666 RepID=UPI00046A8BA8|nr:AEC family transporter [Sulfurospirillum arcachonense]